MAELIDIDRLMDDLLPDQKVKDDLAQILWSEGPAKVKTEKKRLKIPINCELAITTKAYFREYYPLNFGPFNVEVAVGGVEEESHGILDAKYCFALFYYDEEFKIMTLDFYKNMALPPKKLTPYK
jgi:hypothetical protein